jgi:hypothetical protein
MVVFRDAAERRSGTGEGGGGLIEFGLGAQDVAAGIFGSVDPPVVRPSSPRSPAWSEFEWETRAMSSPRVESCPNCGAPLQLNNRSQCVFCRAQIHSNGDWGPEVPPPGAGLLRTIGMLLSEPAAARVVTGSDLTEGVSALLDAVVTAGQRVQDEGLTPAGTVVDLKIYRPVELWIFNLAADVLALLATAPNVPKVKRAAVNPFRQSLDAGLGSHSSRSTIGNVRPAPPEFEALRAAIPKRTFVRL